MQRRRFGFLVVVLAAAAACPDPVEVGGAPKQQLDDVHLRVGKIESKTAAQANEADAASKE